MNRGLETLVSVVVGLNLLYVPSIHALDNKTVSYSSWYIYWDSKAVNCATAQYGAQLDHIGMFGAAFDQDGQPPLFHC